MVLYINCCPRKESRTARLAEAVLEKLGEYEEVRLYERKPEPVDAEKLEIRMKLLEEGDLQHPAFADARRFAAADIIVIAAPFWDLSFPAMLKNYIENIYITGIVSRYGEDGRPAGLCRAKKLYYVTTAGGPLDPRFGYGYVSELAKGYFGIPETELIFAEMLDIETNDPEEILQEAIGKIAAVR